MTAQSKILWGVCGIGHGHVFRQLPLIEHFAKDSEIVIFGYGESYEFYARRFAASPHVHVAKVAVPYYVGDANGLDFAATAARPENRQDYATINAAAMAFAAQKIGRPDLVISDYEPVSAQYAYAHKSRLVTIDQQSKYLCGDFPQPLNGQYFNDEVMRLRLFFPQADKRLACSFFRVAQRSGDVEDVEIYPPVLSEKILAVRRAPDPKKVAILMYVSAQMRDEGRFAEIEAACASLPDVDFHMFGKGVPACADPNVQTYEHGDARFYDVLATCHGIVSTAGHGLLSEAMHLGIPVYAMPLPLYEQEMNAHILQKHGFGMANKELEPQALARFIRDIPKYAQAIEADRATLLRTPGQRDIIECLKRRLGKGLGRA